MELLELRKEQQFRREEEQRTDKDSRREDTGFAEESSEFFTVEEPSLSASGPVDVSAGQMDGSMEESTPLPVPETQGSSSGQMGPSQPGLLVPPRDTEKAATLPMDPLRSQALHQEGMLGRKHELEAAGKKASNRSWNSLYCVLKPGQLSSYKDAKGYGYGVTYHGEDPLQLAGATCDALPGYKKKKHVLKLRLADGSEYLFQCKDEEELVNWKQALERAAEPQSEDVNAGPSGARAHSLPPPSSSTIPEATSAKKDKEKRFSLFTKKK